MFIPSNFPTGYYCRFGVLSGLMPRNFRSGDERWWPCKGGLSALPDAGSRSTHWSLSPGCAGQLLAGTELLQVPGRAVNRLITCLSSLLDYDNPLRRIFIWGQAFYLVLTEC